MKKLALFPLGVVLFPGSTLPLHIFEERYKTLIERCLMQKENFGINLVDPHNLHDTGCSAEVFRVLKKYSDGRMDIIVKGIKRYSVDSFLEDIEPYYIADVNYFDDEEDSFDRDLMVRCIDLFNAITDKIKTIRIEKIDPEKIGTVKPSFVIAQKSGLSLMQRQELLEIRSEDERLQALIDHLNTLLPIIKETELVTRIVKNDGYFPPNII